MAGTVLAGAQAVLFGVSAGQGMRRAKECGEAKREFYRDVTQQLGELERESASSSKPSTSDDVGEEASRSREDKSPAEDSDAADDGTSDQTTKESKGKYVGIARAAEYCGVSKRKVWDAMQSDELEVVSTPTGKRITWTSLEAYCSEDN